MNLLVASWFIDPEGVKMKRRSYLKALDCCKSDINCEKILLICKVAITELPLFSRENDSSGDIANAS